MARIRTIKPDHWEDENWNDVSLQSHLLFIGMKNFADDKGVIKDNPVLIKNKVFPTREDIRTSDIKTWLSELSENSFLVPLEFERKGYYVMDFSNEKIDKPQPSILPDYIIIPFIKAIREHSRTFENIPPVEESSGEGEEEETESIAHDVEFENLILKFFGFNEINHFKNFKKFRECCAAIFFADKFDYFKIQCKNYKKYIELIGERYLCSFDNFLGKQENKFEDGVWDKENWEKKFADRQVANLLSNKGATAVVATFSQNKMNE